MYYDNPTQVGIEISELNLTGNIIPHNWAHHIVKRTKGGIEKPDFLAIQLLADIIYWYRVKKKTNKQTGEVSLYKKFKADKLQKHYADYAKQFNVSKRKIKTSIDLLINLGLITREIRIIMKDEQLLSGVVFLEPVPSEIKKITNMEDLTTLSRRGVTENTKEGGTQFSNHTETTYTQTTKNKKYNNKIIGAADIPNRNLSPERKNSKKEEAKTNACNLSETVSTSILPRTYDKIPKKQSSTLNVLLEKMKIYNKEDLVELTTKIKDCTNINLDYVFLDILDKLETGELEEYTPRYVLNAIEFHLIKLDNEGKLMNPNVFPRLKRFCIELLGDGQDAIDVYKFYSKILSSAKSKGSKEHASLVERQKKNIKMLITTYGKERFLKSVKQFRTGLEEGILDDPTIRHFTNYVKYQARPREKITEVADSTITPASEDNNSASSEDMVVPIPYERVGSTRHSKGEYPPHFEKYNWLFKCTCNHTIDAWKKECPFCSSKFSWKEVDIDNPVQIKQEINTDEQRKTIM